ncbi:hypothetical protein [Amycolatopsis pithecellobii]|uniref:Uncharacterized protein n=1 Tax=Amycolatopsis pithecellobii TaxID=664692 RepID=A0A6N7Z4R8_9PSEU|nr:hypothetical protein [Amycolatopsis pithecellobii]MTD57163.1 hypothetical protein [Amycolatopsis pithecellobii]
MSSYLEHLTNPAVEFYDAHDCYLLAHEAQRLAIGIREQVNRWRVADQPDLESLAREMGALADKLHARANTFRAAAKAKERGTR